MAIIKHTTAAGITYCYDSTPKWDPVKKQARPQKKYLGRWDEETQTIIPTTGKRGRKKKKNRLIMIFPCRIIRIWRFCCKNVRNSFCKLRMS